MAEIPHTTITVPAVKEQSFDKLYIYNLVAHSPVVGVGSLRLELLPFDGQTLGPASEMVTFSSDKLFEVLAAVPEAAVAFEAITKAIPALLAYQKSQAGAGTRGFINDSNAAASGNFGAVVASGGANAVPVYSDGTDWRIG